MRKTLKNKKPAQARLEIRRPERRTQKNKSLTAQEIQDEIFRKMSAAKKIKLASELTMFCLKLNDLNKGKKPTGAPFASSQSSPRA